MMELANGNRRGSFLERDDRIVLADHCAEVAERCGRGHITNIMDREDLDEWEFEIVEGDDSVVWMGAAARQDLARGPRR